jgi:hypothetical protein
MAIHTDRSGIGCFAVKRTIPSLPSSCSTVDSRRVTRTPLLLVRVHDSRSTDPPRVTLLIVTWSAPSSMESADAGYPRDAEAMKHSEKKTVLQPIRRMMISSDRDSLRY